MKTVLRIVVVVVLIAACIGSESLGAVFDGPVDDGWHTWQVRAADGGELQIYVSIESGEPVQFRLRSNSICSGNFDVDATDLGFIDVDESIDWLQTYIEPRSRLGSDIIMAISLHSGARPVVILATIVKTQTDREIREEALFWLGQSDSDAAFDVFDRLLSGNASM